MIKLMSHEIKTMIKRMTKRVGNKIRFIFIVTCLFVLFTSCYSIPTAVRGPAPMPVNLPFMRLEQGGECYYIDDFMPTPDSLVTGKTTGLYLRYYTYWNARYKYWSEVGIMLSFY